MDTVELKDKLRDAALDFFINSGDFNGLHLERFSECHDLSESQIKNSTEQLLRDNEIDLAFASLSVNPHIKRIKDLSVEEQIQRLQKEPLSEICIYPKSYLVEKRIDLSKYSDRPFTKRLWQVEPQLTEVYFDLGVLERYFRDARYKFDFEDLQGKICVCAEHYDSASMSEKDKVFLKTFGIGYDNSRNRVVVVYLRYLSCLSPEHQQYWQTFVCREKCITNSDYYKSSILGVWTEFISVYVALLQEQFEINRICQLIGRSPLFLKTFEKDRPKGFHTMLHPTKKNFYDFAHLLDKMISENISHKFFGEDVDFENIKEHDDGILEREKIGTLQLLNNWLSKFYKLPDSQNDFKELFSSFRKVRKLRQDPAHSIQEDQYDIQYAKKQDDLVREVYYSLMVLRIIFSKHPQASSYNAPEWLREDKIVFY